MPVSSARRLVACCTDRNLTPFHVLDRVDLFLEVQALWRMCTFIHRSRFLLWPAALDLGFGGLPQFVARRLEGRRKNGHRVKAEDRVFVLVTRRMAFAQLD